MISLKEGNYLLGKGRTGLEIYKREVREFKPGGLHFFCEAEDKVSGKRMRNRVTEKP